MPSFFIYLYLVGIKVNFVIGQGCSLGNELKDYKAGDQTFKDVDQFIKEFNGFTNINKDEIIISTCGRGDEMKYSTYEVENNKLILKTKNMEEFEETTISSDNFQDFCIHLKINCDNFDKDLIFSVDDTNNHDPYFVDEKLTNQTTFSFEIPMPFPPNIGLEALGPKYQLWARDIDISNTKVDFTIEPNDYFKIDYKEPVENKLNKVHAATFVAKQFINFDDQDFKITVTDKGDPVRKADGKITVKRSEEAGQIPVGFEKNVYEGEYEENSNVININDKIILKVYENLSIKVENNENNFSGSIEANGEVKINVIKPIENIVDDYIILSVQAKDSTGKTVAETSVVTKIIKKPTASFDKDSYEGELDLSNDKIENLSEIKIERPPKNVEGRIEQTECRDNFEATFDKTKQTFTLVYIKPIDVKDKKVISFTLEAINDKKETVANTIVILILKNRPISRFLKDSYEGEIDLSTEDIENLPEIKIDHPPENVGGRIEQTEYRDNFDISFDKTKDTITLIYIKPIDIKDKKIISFTLEALNDKMEMVANTVVILTLKNRPIPRFLKDSYEGEIDLSTEFIKNLPEIKIDHPPENVQGRIEKTEYRDNFDIIFDSTKQTFTLVYQRPIDVEDKNIISFTLEALNDKMEVVASTIIILIVETKVIYKDYPLVPYAYKVVRIFEGLGSREVLRAYDGNKKDEYEYCIVIVDPDQKDEDGEELFFIDEHGVVMSRNLDREAEYFRKMTKPQFLLTLKLKKKGNIICGEITRRKRDIIFSRLIGDLFLYDEIDNSPIKSIISVIVEDVHDNQPIFHNNEVTVCYPNKDLLEIVRPAYITKVFASHLDSIESSWSIVTYSSNDAEIFVDPKAGYVFPSDIFYSSSKREFTITASDGGNRTNELKLKVKIIDDDKISIIKLPNADFDNLENKLKELSLEADIELNILSAASIPADEKNTRFSLLKNEDLTLKLFIYGLNNKKEPVNTTDIEKSLEEVSHVDVSKFDGNSCEESFIGEDDVTEYNGGCSTCRTFNTFYFSIFSIMVLQV